MEVPSTNTPEQERHPERHALDLTQYSDQQILELNAIYCAEFDVRNTAGDTWAADSFEFLKDALRQLLADDPDRAKRLLTAMVVDKTSIHRELAATWAPYFAHVDSKLASWALYNLDLDEDEMVGEAASGAMATFEKLATAEQARSLGDRIQRAIQGDDPDGYHPGEPYPIQSEPRRDDDS
ncbi:MAG TPA: hypothetical protein VFU43_04045 [Streptosporangiaceae bacterium]|nr:hypothetical protein [Streptosporangiaceae bacterium]